MATQQTVTTPLRQRPAYAALEQHYHDIRDRHLRDLFQQDAKRGQRFALEAVGLYFDYSKHRITDETLRLLMQLARESGVEARRDAMFRGEKINTTEDRAVLHAALRMPRDEQITVDGTNVIAEVHDVLDKMQRF